MAPRVEIRVPRTHAAERAYAASVVVGEFLGIDHVVRRVDGHGVVLRLEGDDRHVFVPDGLFAHNEADWLTPASLPREPVAHRDVGVDLPDARLVDCRLPILYPVAPETRPLLETDAGQGSTTLHLDVFGTAFFTLTRYEEAVDQASRDEHGRFPARASVAYRAGFLTRPIADEYAEVLRAVLRRVWPRLDLRSPAGGVWLTHDVDLPLVAAGRRWRRVARSAGADLLLRRSPGLARTRIGARMRAGRGDPDRDPANTFDFLMSVAEAAGLRACFNFLADGKAEADGSYRLTDPWIHGLLRRIASRGHELGFHGSYEAFDDAGRIAEEFAGLRTAANTLAIAQPEWGGRQHFLRWSNPWTWRAWSEAGLRHDSSVYFAELPGFRTGSARAYPVFDLARRRPLQLVERPLTFMDTSAARYLRLNADQTLELALRLAETCKAVGGTFVLLWHNDAVMTEPSRRLYRDLVTELG